jgi:hypothetical protein
MSNNNNNGSRHNNNNNNSNNNSSNNRLRIHPGVLKGISRLEKSTSPQRERHTLRVVDGLSESNVKRRPAQSSWQRLVR